MLENIFLTTLDVLSNASNPSNGHPSKQNKINVGKLSSSSQHKKNGKSSKKSSKKSTTYMAYPDESELLNSKEMVQKILQSQKLLLEKNILESSFTDDFLHSNMKAIRIDGVKILITPLPHKFILGLVFDIKTNPFDYQNELIRLLLEYFLPQFLDSSKKVIKTTLLLTLFVDIRKYANESLVFQGQQRDIMVMNNIPMLKVFVYGIDNAGKSSLMRLLATGKFEQNYFPPTKKFRITNIKLDSGIKLVCWDMPGQKVFRRDWLRGAQASNILLFVLDIDDKKRYEEARIEFWNMINLYELQGIPLIFLANKVDLIDEKMTEDVIISDFKLNDIIDRNWKLIYSSLPDNVGINDLIKWMEKQAEELLILNGIKTSV
jgi:small GTP-binding protein